MGMQNKIPRTPRLVGSQSFGGIDLQCELRRQSAGQHKTGENSKLEIRNKFKSSNDPPTPRLRRDGRNE
jgi:hypothetical protein